MMRFPAHTMTMFYAAKALLIRDEVAVGPRHSRCQVWKIYFCFGPPAVR
jgi:uncharacterized protein (UPF0332 family)